MEAYLDNAATTKISDSVKEAMLQVYECEYGNPSSKHTKGMEAENKIKEAREEIAAGLKCRSGEIIFTSGGTEANNMAVIGSALANRRAGNHIITTRIEHPSIHEPLGWLAGQGFEITYLPVDENGHISPEELETAITEETILVSLMHVNNEIGSILDIEALCRAAKGKRKNLIFHTDAIQSYGKYRLYPAKWGIDLLSVSAHKIHGPKGVGFLYCKEGTKINPILFGGGQQKGMRSGTENVPGIVGLGAAVKEIYEGHQEKIEKLYALKEHFIEKISDLEGVTVNGIQGISPKETAPHIISVSFAGIRSEVLLHALAEKGVYVSSGSACSSHHPALSGTLKAVGVKEELLDSTLRFSTSMCSTEAELDYAVECVRELLPVLRRYTRH